jgi:hypothetical protein
MTLTLIFRVEPSAIFRVRSMTTPNVRWIDCNGVVLGVDHIDPEHPDTVHRCQYPLTRVAELQLSEP